MRFDVLFLSCGRVAVSPSALGDCERAETREGVTCLGEVELDYSLLPDAIAHDVAMKGIGYADDAFENLLRAKLAWEQTGSDA